MDRQFANPFYWLLLLPPIIGLLHFRFLKLRQKTLVVISPASAPATVSPLWPVITSIAFLLFVIAWLRPQWGFELEERQQSGVDIVIAVDVSPSMLASDTPPSRLKLAQRAIIDLLSRLQGDKIALVAFSGVAFTETPLTLDYSTFRLFLNQLSPDLIPLRGTNIELALRESLKTLLPTEEKDEPSLRARAIILITDGESFAGDIDSIVPDLQENAVDLSIISVGTETGAPVPGDIGYKRHNDGSTVISRLDVKALKGLAEATSGHYYNLNQSSFDLGEVYENGIKRRLTATVEEGGQVKVWGEWFQLPLAFGLLLLIIRQLRNTFLRSYFTKKAVTQTPLAILFFILFIELSAPVNTIAQNEAPQTSTSTEQTHGTYDENMREGIERFRKGFFNSAEQYFTAAATLTESNEEKAIALFNQGNALTQLGKLEEALQILQSARQLAPSDQEIIDNVSYLKKLIKSQNSQSEEQDKQEQNEQEGEQSDGSSGKNGQGDSSDDGQKGEEGKEGGESQNEKQSSDKNSDKPENQQDSKPGDSGNKQDEPQEDNDSAKKDGSQQSSDEKDSGEQSSEGKSPDEHEQQTGAEKDIEENTEDNAGEKANANADGKADGKDKQGEEAAVRSAGSNKPDEQQPLTSQLEAIIGGIEENTANYDNFRREQAIQILKEHYGSRVPEEDW